MHLWRKNGFASPNLVRGQGDLTFSGFWCKMQYYYEKGWAVLYIKCVKKGGRTMKRIVLIVSLMVLIAGCAVPVRPNPGLSWLRGQRVAVCGNYYRDYLDFEVKKYLRDIYGANVVSSGYGYGCNNIPSGANFVAIVEHHYNYYASASKVTVEIVRRDGTVVAMGESLVTQSFVSAGYRGRKAGGSFASWDADPIASAVLRAVADLH